MRAAPDSLAKAKPSWPERIGLSPLAGLARLRSAINRDGGTELVNLVREIEQMFGLFGLILSVAFTARARKLIDAGERRDDVAELLNVNRTTLYRALR